MKQITVKIKWRQGKLNPHIINLALRSCLPLIQVLEVTRQSFSINKIEKVLETHLLPWRSKQIKTIAQAINRINKK